jgi:hypothetical protein
MREIRGEFLIFIINLRQLRGFVEPQCIAALRFRYQELRKYLIRFAQLVKIHKFSA